MRASDVARDRPAARLAQPLREFMETEVSGGLVLLGAVAVALIWANSPWSGLYDALWSTEIGVRIGRVTIVDDLRHWVNDGLMVIFFFVIGLEIKRELVVGDLASWKNATLPAAAALGGMLVPALLYVLFNREGEAARGWGIPMATDIALALGVLALLHRSVPSRLRVLLLSLAIVDDIGAVVVIAVFYTESINAVALAAAGALVATVVGLRRLRLLWVPIYVAVGAGVWLATLQSGVHATVAGVVLGLLAPARPLTDEDLDGVPDRRGEPEDAVPAQAAHATKARVVAAVPVTERLEHLLHPWTSFLVLPVFALANAGVALDLGGISQAAVSRIAWGIVTGLVAGKLVGICGSSYIAVRLGASLPEGVGWRHVVGMSALAGVGFTMSLFITGLAFEDAAAVNLAKTAILAASLGAAGVGAALLRGAGGRAEE